jgi:transcriptional regulator with XRE-family HTH domain
MSDSDYRTPGPKALGEAIRDLREKRGWSQTQFAEKLDMNKAHVCKIEKSVRAPGWVVLMKLTHVLGAPFVAELADVLLREIEECEKQLAMATTVSRRSNKSTGSALKASSA